MKLRVSILLVAAVMIAAALATESSASAPAWKTERYYSNETSHSFADIGKKDGGGPDDIYVSQQTLTDLSGASAGVVNGYGVNLHAPYVYFQYTGVVSDGTLNLEGAVDLKRATQVYAISGGSGAYTGASGTVTTSDAGSKGTLVVIRYRVS